MSQSNVQQLQYGEKTIYLLGTAHVSRASVDEVKELIERIKPDTVCVELDELRYEGMFNPDRWKKLDIFQIVREKKVLYLLANLVLSSHQKKIGEALGVEPGGELKQAVESAKEHGAELVLADRNIQATLKRTWGALGFFDKAKLLSAMLGSFLDTGEEITEEQIENLKDRDHLSEAMAEFAKHLPQVKRPLIDERDSYLISAIREANGRSIVAVVGAGHVPGMVKNLESPIDRELLSQLPKPSLWTQLFKWLIPAIVLGAFFFGYQKHSGAGLEQMLYSWLVPNIVLAGLFAAVAKARPIVVLVAALASPITSLNPMLGAGMVAGLVQARLVRPTVQDCEAIPKDALSLGGFYRNPFLHVLLITFAASLGSALGGFLGAGLVVRLLGS